MRYEPSIIPSRLNPELSPELEREVAFFKKWGYLVVEDALRPEQVAILRTALDGTFDRLGSQFTHQLLEEDDRFSFLLDNPPVLERIRALLGTCLQLHSATARVTLPGEPDQRWHRDGPWPMDPDGTPYGSVPGQINVGYYLDELTEENGPIVLVPGSQRVAFRPPDGSPRFPDEVRVYARPGQAVLFDGWLFHRGAANQSRAPRRVCLMCYQNAWMKSREAFDGPRVSALRDGGSAEQRLLLGGAPRW
jgi:ectoine hydroxylase-related dioxygenase (phytanoyl-CoA dioxygenase family)